MSMPTPKPCPFCGHPPEVSPQNPKTEGDAWGAVRCVNSKCPTTVLVVRDGEPFIDGWGPDEYKKAAILRWNTRK